MYKIQFRGGEGWRDSNAARGTYPTIADCQRALIEAYPGRSTMYCFAWQRVVRVSDGVPVWTYDNAGGVGIVGEPTPAVTTMSVQGVSFTQMDRYDGHELWEGSLGVTLIRNGNGKGGWEASYARAPGGDVTLHQGSTPEEAVRLLVKGMTTQDTPSVLYRIEEYGAGASGYAFSYPTLEAAMSALKDEDRTDVDFAIVDSLGNTLWVGEDDEDDDWEDDEDDETDGRLRLLGGVTMLQARVLHAYGVPEAHNIIIIEDDE